RDAEPGIVDERRGQRLVARDIRAHAARKVVEGAAHLEAFDDLVDAFEAALEAVALAVALERDLREDSDRSSELFERQHGLISRDDASGFEPAHPLEARPRCQTDHRCELLNGRTAIALQRRKDLDIDRVERSRAHELSPWQERRGAFADPVSYR